MITVAIIAVIIRVTAPILLAGVGTLYNDRAGVTNITVEGTMLMGAFVAVVCSFYTHSWVLAVLAGVLSGMLVSYLFSFITSTLGGDELVVGFAANVLIDGLTIFLLKEIFKQSGSIVSDSIVGIPRIEIPFLKGIPVLDQIFNNQTWIVYLAFISVFITQIILYRTPFGMRIHACGENPSAAATVGINVKRIRLICNLIAGAVAGLAGVQIALGFLSMFSEGMIVGRGFIALGAVIYSKGKPLRVLVITLFFGIAEALSNLMQFSSMPSELVLMFPYVAVVLLTLFRFSDYKKKKSKMQNNKA